MSYKLQPFAMSDAHDALPLQNWRSALPANWEDGRFFRSWLVYDTGVRPGLELPRIKLAQTAGAHAGGRYQRRRLGWHRLMIAHFWK
jgi:hypothetical protein